MTLSTHSYMLALRVGVSNDNERRIGGLAVPYNLTASTKDGLERVAPDAFRQVLAATRDILLLADHQPDRLLARRASGNLTLTDSAAGLRFSAKLPDTQLGRDTYEMTHFGLDHHIFQGWIGG